MYFRAQCNSQAGTYSAVVPLDATASLTLEGRHRDGVFHLGTPLNNQLAALFQLWDRPTPTLFDPVAVADARLSRRHAGGTARPL